MENLSYINTKEELAKYLGIRTQLLTYVLYGKKDKELYHRFTIPKKSGGERIIHAPIKPLKYIQKNLACKLNQHIEYVTDKNQIINKISHGFIKEKSILTNATAHKGKHYVLNIDLEDFFPTLHFGRVKGFFIHNKHFKIKPKIAIMIAQLTCFDGSLPQGAPTSPIISNLIANNLDMNILKITKKYNLDYTRYVDDLTFSTNKNDSFKNKKHLLFEIESIINQSGFKINKSKTRIQYYNSRQSVTGLTVNKKINTKKEFRKNTRAMAHKLYTNGRFYINDKEGTIKQLNGRFEFINQLDWENNKDKERKDIEDIPYLSLNSREKDYQKFIFYKNFIRNKPLVITEGKTDIAYLKAALKNGYQRYPNLLNELFLDNKSIYNISFLNRFKSVNQDTKKQNKFVDPDKKKKKQNKWLYFFNFANDGASPISKIIDAYVGVERNKVKFPGYWNYFKAITPSNPSNPVIIILDNDKELRKFLNQNCHKIVSYNRNNNDDLKKNESSKEKMCREFRDEIDLNLLQKNYAHLIGNLYLGTLPEKENSKTVEMEDLFNSQIIEEFNVFNNREIKDPKIINDSDKYRFSSYVLKNYETINFEKFKPVLKMLNEIIKSYNQNP